MKVIFLLLCVFSIISEITATGECTYTSPSNGDYYDFTPLISKGDLHETYLTAALNHQEFSGFAFNPCSSASWPITSGCANCSMCLGPDWDKGIGICAGKLSTQTITEDTYNGQTAIKFSYIHGDGGGCGCGGACSTVKGRSSYITMVCDPNAATPEFENTGVDWCDYTFVFKSRYACPKTTTCSTKCKNGGKCTGPDVCTCTSGYTGYDCSSPVCYFGCQNGGTCSGPNICSCPLGWTGPTCSTQYTPASTNCTYTAASGAKYDFSPLISKGPFYGTYMTEVKGHKELSGFAFKPCSSASWPVGSTCDSCSMCLGPDWSTGKGTCAGKVATQTVTETKVRGESAIKLSYTHGDGGGCGCGGGCSTDKGRSSYVNMICDPKAETPVFVNSDANWCDYDFTFRSKYACELFPYYTKLAPVSVGSPVPTTLSANNGDTEALLRGTGGWNGGWYDMPQKYIIYDFKSVIELDRIVMILNQTPAGKSTHAIFDSNGNLLQRFSGYTENFQELSYTFPAGTMTRSLKILTERSVSNTAWHSITILRK